MMFIFARLRSLQEGKESDRLAYDDHSASIIRLSNGTVLYLRQVGRSVVTFFILVSILLFSTLHLTPRFVFSLPPPHLHFWAIARASKAFQPERRFIVHEFIFYPPLGGQMDPRDTVKGHRIRQLLFNGQ